MYTVFVDPNYGLAPALRHTAGPLLSSGAVIGLVTWSVIGMELGIAASALAGPRTRRVGVALAVLLHSGIVLAIGLFSFGLIMMALVLMLCLGGGKVPAACSRTAKLSPVDRVQDETAMTLS